MALVSVPFCSILTKLRAVKNLKTGTSSSHLKLPQNRWVHRRITFFAKWKVSFSMPVDSFQNVLRPEPRGRKIRLYITLHSFSRVLVIRCFGFSACSVNSLFFFFSHLESVCSGTVPNFALNSAACNRLHAFAWCVLGA